MIENVAELLAMFKDGNEYIYTKENGENIELTITNAIRQGQYEYIYEDRNALENRKAKFDQLLNLFNSVGQNEQLFNMIDWKETITTAVEMLGFDDPDKFFKTDQPEVAQFKETFDNIPDDLKTQAAQLFLSQIQQYQQQMQQQEQQQQMQAQAQNQVQMQMYRDQARQQAEQNLLAQQAQEESLINGY